MQLSRRPLAGWARGKVKCEQTNKPHLAIEPRLRQLFPPAAAPAFASVRPDATHDPGIELGEELSYVCPLVVVAPTTQFRRLRAYAFSRTGPRKSGPSGSRSQE